MNSEKMTEISLLNAAETRREDLECEKSTQDYSGMFDFNFSLIFALFVLLLLHVYNPPR